MKKLVLFSSIMALLLLASCGNKSKSTTTNADESITETPEHALEKIYSIVISDYNTDGQNPDISNLDEFVTPEYRKLQDASDKKAEEKSEAGPVDWDVWTNAQDYQELKLLGIRKVKDETDGVVMMATIENCGAENDVYVKMTQQGDQWFISDFLYNFEDSLYSTAHNMEQYLNGK